MTQIVADTKPPKCPMSADNVEISEVVIGAAMKVLNTLRPGLDEKLYERALVIELRKCGVACEQQKAYEVFYEGVVDPKVVTDFNETHVAQMIGYLNITGLTTALLLNFKYTKLGIKRVSQSRNA